MTDAPGSQASYEVSAVAPTPWNSKSDGTYVPGGVVMWFDSTDAAVPGGAPRPASAEFPLPVKQVLGGDVGLDASGGQPGALTVLASFAVSNPGAYYVQNQSAATLQVIFDDGSATAGTVSVQLLAPGAGANAQGGDTAPAMAWFTGRIRVAGPAGAQFMARHS